MLFLYNTTKKYNYLSNDKISKIINIIIFIFIFITFVVLDKIKRIHLDPIYKKINEFEISNIKSFFHIFFIENEISKIKKFWKINEKNGLIDTINIKSTKKSETPKISIIITIFNQLNCFFKALRSIQNQSFKDIEIIIVDDGSTDDAFNLLEKYQKQDYRIILLKHSYNYGTIKSRSDAVKLAKGKYIIILDGDDGFSSREILYNSFNIAEIGGLDVVEFKMAYFKNKYFKRIENNLEPIDNLYNRIIYQPELKYKFIKLQGKDNLWSYLNRNIVSKLIRNELFKKVLEFIGPKYTEDNIIIFEDTIMSVSLFCLSHSFYLMKQPGYYRSKGECFINSSKKVQKKCGLNYCIFNKDFDSIKYINFLSEKLNSSKIEGELIYNELVNIDYNYDLYKNINNNFDYVFKVFEMILLKFTLLNYKQKNMIINLKNRIIKKKTG